MTAKPTDISTLIPAIRAVANWLHDFDAPSAIIGGIAAGLLGRARNTVDIDAVVLIDYDRLAEFVDSASRFDIVPRIDRILEFAATSRVLLLKHRSSDVEVDVSLAGMPFEEELLERAVETNVAGILVRLPTVEDLIVMKCVANRHRDWADIEGLIDAHPHLDSDRVLLWSRRFADIMEAPEVIEQLEKLLHSARLKEIEHRSSRRSTKKTVKQNISKIAQSKPAGNKVSQKGPKKAVAKKVASRSRKKPLQD